MAGEVFVDALPYIDQGYDEPGVRESALALVEEETRRYRPTKNYLENLPPLSLNLFETELMKNEFERLQQRLPMDTLSMKRYELPPPPAAKISDLSAWNECVDNSMAQLEHQATRICNLELMVEYGCEAWRSYIELLMKCVSHSQKQLQTMRHIPDPSRGLSGFTSLDINIFPAQLLRKEIQEINWERKHAQTKAGEKLKKLEMMWDELVKKNYEIEQACVELEESLTQEQKNQMEILNY